MPNNPSIIAQEGPQGPAGATGPAGPAPSGTGVVTVSAGVASATPAGDGLALGSTLAVQAADASVTVGPSGVTIQSQLDAVYGASQAYAQSLTYNISSKEPAHAATTASLPAYTVNVAKTVITASVNGVLPPASIDGQTLNVGERLLVKDEAGALSPNNGIYVLTAAGAPNPGGSKWVLTRTSDADTGAELCGAQLPVDTGNTLAGTVWLFSANQNTFVLGTTSVLWIQITVPAATTTTAGVVQLAGDIGGTYTSVTVTGIQGNAVTAGSLTTGQVLRATASNASGFGALDLANASAVTGALPTVNQVAQSMGGDVSGTTAAAVVTQLQGRAVLNAAPASNQVLTWNGSAWAPANTAATGVTSVTAASPLASSGGTTPQISISSGSATGNTLGWNGTAWTSSALNLAGGANYVTGLLPTANQAAQSMGNDVSGTTATAVVAKINGSSVPAGGSLTTGQVLRATGASALGYGAVDLANASAVTGVLPLANQSAPATANAFPYTATSGTWNSTGLSGTNQLIGFNGSTPSAVTVGSNLTLSGGTLASTAVGPGSRVALDANTLLAYYCNETSGTTLVNSGTVGSSANLTLSGATGAYVLNDLGLYTFGTNALRMTGLATTDGAFVSGLSILAGINVATIEATVALSYGYTVSLFELSDNARSNLLQIAYSSGNLVASLYISGSSYTVSFGSIPSVTGRICVACVRNGATWNLYINGVPASATGTTVTGNPAFSAFTKFTIGNNTNNGYAFKGCIADVRVSNVARSQSYLLNSAKVAGTL